MHSCIYEGIVAHRRREPVEHRFQYRLFMVYLDLDELPSLVAREGLLGQRGRLSQCFLRSDHLFDPSRSLADEVRDIILTRTGQSCSGPIRLLTQLRYFGYYMSPLNLYYAFDETGRRVKQVVAEVSNTPWGERYCYVLWNGNREGGTEELKFSHAKEFHVSPFMAMDLQYRWQLSAPGQRLHLHLANYHKSQELFDAGMTLERRELSRSRLRSMMFRYPLMTAQISAAIYYQALKLWWKKCPFYPHPNQQSKPATSVPTSPKWPVSAGDLLQ
ncbi:MAG: DUF1365 domain-containing protein [Planctomycetales bacterium]|nr:DUF1365 domain-containing protein [Planctomycetales bacterium]